MPQYLIERNIPGAGKLTAAELKGISQKSCAVLNMLGPTIQWVHSYVTDNQIMCVYRAPTKRSCASTRSRAAFRPTRSRKSRRRSIPPPRVGSMTPCAWIVLSLMLPALAAAQGQPSRSQILAGGRDIIQKAGYCSFITAGEDGHPQARIVDPLGPDESFTFYSPPTR